MRSMGELSVGEGVGRKGTPRRKTFSGASRSHEHEPEESNNSHKQKEGEEGNEEYKASTNDLSGRYKLGIGERKREKGLSFFLLGRTTHQT